MFRKRINILSLLTLVILLFGVRAYAELNFRGQNHSLINWKFLELDSWLDYREWLVDRTEKDKNPNWENHYREANLKELMGRVISCINECRIYRGKGYVNARYLSSIKEGDEVQTLNDGHAWIFLMDGTTVRISPNTSITFKEINIANDQIFIHARVNDGNILWLSRSSKEYREMKRPETDAIFLPLSLMEANSFFYKNENDISDDEKLAQVLQEDQTVYEHYQRLNTFINQNNVFIKEKPTFSFIVLPNGTLYGKNIQAQIYHHMGGVSYFKRNDPDTYLKEPSYVESNSKFYFRGYLNLEERDVADGVWYKVDSRGRTLEEFDTDEFSNVGEIITSRIPSILIARELMLKKYSQFIFDDVIDPLKLAVKYGYRLWNRNLKDKKTDLERRIKFLKEYTRRIETSILFTAEKVRRELKGGESEEFAQGYNLFDPIFHKQAMSAYIDSISRPKYYYEKMSEDIDELGREIWLIKNRASR